MGIEVQRARRSRRDPILGEVPSLAECAAYVRRLGKPLAAEVMREARVAGRVLVQPRCGVGGHPEMLALLEQLELGSRPEILSLTIDSHTRLKQFSTALRILNTDPSQLNGYPLVSHGWQRGRELNEAVQVPIEVRHGSPDGRDLFKASIAAGFTSFEGGAITYNLPYCKDVPLSDSLAAWHEVDRACGELASMGLVIDRELFGSLTGVLVPPSLSLAVTMLEAILAIRDGVRCVSIAYPQNGNAVQDVAALRCIPELARRYLPGDVEVNPVLHEFMGVFPRDRTRAFALILLGGLLARLGAATKVITKTCDEAFGIPSPAANVEGMLAARAGLSSMFESVRLDESQVAAEMAWIQREVAELVEPVLAEGDLDQAIVIAFAEGRLDVPFSASRHARSDVLPRRDQTGAVRYLRLGELPFSPDCRRRNRELLEWIADGTDGAAVGLLRDLEYFAAPSA